MSRMTRITHAFLTDESGQGLVEYALIIALVSVAAIVALKFVSGRAQKTLSTGANQLS